MFTMHCYCTDINFLMKRMLSSTMHSAPRQVIFPMALNWESFMTLMVECGDNDLDSQVNLSRKLYSWPTSKSGRVLETSEHAH